jgi:Immunoglobulin-like domain of bacterial spore germination
MNVRRIALLAAVGLVALPALAGATSQLTATNVRIGDHPAFIRVVVDFNGNVSSREVEADSFATTMATVHVLHPGVTTQVATRRGDGLRVALQPGTQMLHIAANFRAHRFKYVSYAVVTGNRLAVDLWKSAPPSKAAEIRKSGCLSLRSWHTAKGAVSVSGKERGVFENMFGVVVRGEHGQVLGRKTLHGRSWSTTVRYHATHRQAGTLEAVDLSAKDGALTCIAQVRVTLPAS